MASRSLNQVQLIGNLTRDPELRYTPNSTAVCTFGLATNRQWVTEAGERKDEVEFHRIVSWQKLAEICGKYLVKGKQVYVQGRLQTRSWKGQDGNDRQTTEIVIDQMIMLGSRKDFESEEKKETKEDPVKDQTTEHNIAETTQEPKNKSKPSAKEGTKKEDDTKAQDDTKEQSDELIEDVPPDDIPF